MITKDVFDLAAISVVKNITTVLPQMISYKSYIQRAILDIASDQEIEDVRDCRINQEMISKLCKLAYQEWQLSCDAKSLYCAAMAVATIIKEYDWGTQYLNRDGLWEIAQRIQNI